MIHRDWPLPVGYYIYADLFDGFSSMFYRGFYYGADKLETCALTEELMDNYTYNFDTICDWSSATINATTLY